MFINIKNQNLIFYLISFIGFLLIYYAFLVNQKQNARTTSESIKVMLRQEKLSYNPNQIARMIVDLEKMRVIKCTSIKKISSSSEIFMNLESGKLCNISRFFLLGERKKENINSLSGEEFEFKYTTINQSTFYISFILILFLFFIVVLITKVFFKSITEHHLKLIEVEKKHTANLKIVTKQVLHDVSSPLMALKAASSVINNKPKLAEKLIVEATKKVEGIVSDLKFKQNNKVIEHVDINLLLSDLVASKRVEYKDQAAKFKLKLTSKKNIVNFDKITLQRVLSNLINNAVESVQTSNALVEINTKVETKKVFIKIIDNGRGIAKEDMEHIFDYGFTKNKKNGSGTGLSHAQKTLEMYNSRITLSSIVGHGTTVTIVLPLKG